MTIAALLGTCLIFVAVGWTGVDHRVQAISIAAVVAVATANAGNTSQDLKTGFLVGATPRRPQIAILVGALGAALGVGWTLTLLNPAGTHPVPETHPAFSSQAVAPAAGGGRAAGEGLPPTKGGFRLAPPALGGLAPPLCPPRVVLEGGGGAGNVPVEPPATEAP